MKTKLLITACAAAAMLMSGTSVATAQGVRHRDIGSHRHHVERRIDNRHFDRHPGPRHFDRHPGPRHFDKRIRHAYRPVMGSRFIHRPAYGRFITHNRERLLLADGVLYREVRTPNGFVYIVVGYI